MRYDKYVRYERDEIVTPSFEEVYTRVLQTLMEDKENKVKEALIKMGWTPPKENEG